MSACAGQSAAGFRQGPTATINQGRAETATVDEDESFTDPVEALAEQADGKLGYALQNGLAATSWLGLEPKEEHFAEDASTTANIAGSVMLVGRAIIVAVVVLIVLGALYNTKIVSNPEYNNTWTQMFDTFAGYGETAFIMIGVGLIAAGAGVALSFFGGMGMGGMGGGR